MDEAIRATIASTKADLPLFAEMPTAAWYAGQLVVSWGTTGEVKPQMGGAGGFGPRGV